MVEFFIGKSLNSAVRSDRITVVQLTVVIPTYNEALNLPKLVDDLFTLPLEGLQVLIVDDNSPDGTGEVADNLKERYRGRLSVIHRQGKLGLGSAYLHGFRQALDSGTEAVAQMDADFSHPPEMLLTMMDTLSSCDVVVGSRYISGGSVDKKWPLWRKALSAFGNFYARTILWLPVRDVTSGFKVWRRDTLLGMPLQRVRSNGYAFQIEMTYLAHRLGYRVQEVPFYFPDREWGESKMSFRIQAEAALRVWQMRFEYRELSTAS
jgi:dolichol-phosphate mannosyltransferase